MNLWQHTATTVIDRIKDGKVYGSSVYDVLEENSPGGLSEFLRLLFRNLGGIETPRYGHSIIVGKVLAISSILKDKSDSARYVIVSKISENARRIFKGINKKYSMTSYRLCSIICKNLKTEWLYDYNLDQRMKLIKIL